ncbi:MAG: hypothetical protein NUW12_04900 [Firmicutes bacterium]|nr:hypothetical protein [Bacillota bacterium]MDH7495286.1 hypothetical protein [Bacillota bacterium]
MEVVRRTRRWWRRERQINPGRIDSWLVSCISVLATAVLVALIVRFAG